MIEKKDIWMALISAVVGGLVLFLGGSALGWFDQKVADSQIEEIARKFVDNKDYSSALLKKMEKSGKFKGEDGTPGISPTSEEVAQKLKGDNDFLTLVKGEKGEKGDSFAMGDLAGHCHIGNPNTKNYEKYSVVPPAVAKKSGEGYQCNCESGWSLVKLGTDYHKVQWDWLYYSCIKL